jgi:8-oxo-dGTP pyrophosphatase MutT (NUDIX family)
MADHDPIARRAGRVLLVDAAGRVLLMRGCDPARPDHRYWFTPGGGLDPGETPAEGAARELYEETGLRVPAASLGAPVHHEVTEFPFDGRWYRQEQEFFLLRVDGWRVDVSGYNDVERRTVDAHRWWPPAELAASGERIYPPDLPELLARVLGDDAPPGCPAPAGGPVAAALDGSGAAAGGGPVAAALDGSVAAAAGGESAC